MSPGFLIVVKTKGQDCDSSSSRLPRDVGSGELELGDVTQLNVTIPKGVLGVIGNYCVRYEQ